MSLIKPNAKLKNWFEHWRKNCHTSEEFLNAYNDLKRLLKIEVVGDFENLYETRFEIFEKNTDFKKRFELEEPQEFYRRSFFNNVLLDKYLLKDIAIRRFEVKKKEERKFAYFFYPEIDENEIILEKDYLLKTAEGWKLKEPSALELDKLIVQKLIREEGSERKAYFNFQNGIYSNENLTERLEAWKSILNDSRNGYNDGSIMDCLEFVKKELEKIESNSSGLKYTFTTNLTGESISYLFGLLHESGILKQEPKTHSYEFISNHVVINKKGRITQGTVKNNFTGANEAVKKRVNEALRGLLSTNYSNQKKA